MIRSWGPHYGALTPAALLRAVGAVLLALGLVTCRDQAAGPSPAFGTLRINPILPSAGRFVGPNLPIDGVHAVVTRPANPTPPLKDITVPFNLNLDQLQLKLDNLSLESTAESLDVTIELLSGTQVLFSGTQRLMATAGITNPPPNPPLPLTFVGPGATLTTLFLAPLDSTLTQGTTLPMRVSGEDAAQQPVPNFYVTWSSSDTNVARINGDGRVSGKVARGTVYVRARTPPSVPVPAGVVESTTVTLVPVAASLQKVSGDNQSGVAGQPLAQPLVVQVTASDQLGVQGVTVNFAPPAGGSVLPVSAVTDANGLAQTTATMPASGTGQVSFTAQASGLQLVTFVENFAAAPTPTWTGAVSIDWFDPANWNTGAVPTATDDVLIPAGTPNAPEIDNSAAVHDLTIQPGATLTTNDISVTVNGSLDAGGTLVGCCGDNIEMAGTGTLRGNFDQVFLNVLAGAVVTLNGSAQLTNSDVQVTGTLILGGHTLDIGTGSISTSNGTGLLTMTNAADLVIAGAANFSGGDETGKLTSGLMNLSGDFNQFAGGSPFSFAASGNHTVQSTGSGVQTISFAAPSSSHFQNIVVGNTGGGSTMGSDFTIAGVAGFANVNIPRIIHGNGHTLTMLNLRMDLITLDDLQVIGGPAITQFDRVTFQNTNPAVTAATITHPGAAVPFTFTDLVFQVTPTSGKYLDVTDTQNDANVLTIDMVNPTPGTDGGFVSVAGGAVVNWPALPPGIRTWTGAVDSDWQNPANWSPAGIPGPNDSVVVAPASNQPVLSTSQAIGALDITSGGVTINGHSLTIARTLATTNVGRLIMQNPVDLVQVFGNASFDGDTELGFMTAGTLVLGGNLTQLASNSLDSYHPSGSHVTSFIGSNPAISFASPGLIPGSSHFQTWVWTPSGPGTMTLNSQALVHGNLIINNSTTVTIANSNGDNLVAGGLVNSAPVVFNGPNLEIQQTAPLPLTLSNLSFVNQDPTATQINLNHPGLATTLQFSNLSFGTVPTTGLYLRANDTNPSDGNPLTIDMVNPTPSTPGSFVLPVGGAVVNWPAAGGGSTWNGSIDSDWFKAGNWSTNQVPTGATDVVVPVTATQPVLTAAASVRNLTINSGAVLNLATFDLTATGNVSVPGNVVAGRVIVVTNGAQVSGNFDDLLVQLGTRFESASVSGPLFVNGLLEVARGQFHIGAQTVFTTEFVTSNEGMLGMTNAAGNLNVSGNATFAGEDPTGILTAGVIRVAGNFTQVAVITQGSFVATGSNRVQLAGNAGQQVSFTSPGPAASRFQDLEILNNSGSITFATDAAVNGQLISHLSSVDLLSNARTLQIAGADLSGVTFLNLTPEILGGTVTQFANVTFTGFPTTAVALRVTRASGTINLDALTFANVPSTGFYLHATDTNPGDGQTLTVNVSNSSPSSGAPFVLTGGGAVVNWPAAGGGGITWNGSVSSDWFAPANWNGGVVPGATDDVQIPGAPNPPILTNDISVHNLVTVSTGFLDVNGNDAAVNGDFSGTVISSSPGGFLLLNGNQTLASGNAPNVQVTGDIGINGLLSVTGDLQVLGSGAHFGMHNPGSLVIVSGNATFDGADATLDMSDGTLEVLGNFTVGAANTPTAFAPSGNHVTVLANGAGPQTIQVANPGLAGNHFATLDLLQPGSFILSTNIVVEQVFTAPGAAQNLAIQGNNGLVQAGSVLATSMVFDNVGLLVTSPVVVDVLIDDVVFQNMNTGVTQLQIDVPGAPANYTFSNLVFSTTPTTGAYLEVSDNAPADGNPLVVDLVNPTPGTDGGFSSAFGGAVINWPAAGGGGGVWTGLVNTDWNDPGNWQGNQVPGAGFGVSIPAGAPNYPQLVSAEQVDDLFIDAGASIEFIDGFLEVTGDLTGGGSMIGGGPEMSGPGAIIDFPSVGSLLVTGQVTLNSSLDLTVGDLLITGFGATFNVNGNGLTIAGGLITQNGGSLIMTNGADQVEVNGDAVFDGGDESGLLSAGLLLLAGNFTQGNTTTNKSFVATGSHHTTFASSNPTQTITFADSVTSFFNDLQVAFPSGVVINSLVQVRGDLQVDANAQLISTDQSSTGDGLDVSGDVTTGGSNLLQLGRLLVGGALNVLGTYNTASTIFTGSGQTAPSGLSYQAVSSSGTVTFAAGATTVSSLTVTGGILTLGGRTTATAGVVVSGGNLKTNNHTLSIPSGSFNTSGTGTLTMQSPLDSVVTGGTGGAFFGGGSTVGLLTDGVIKLGGSFGQTAGTSNTSFAASGNHKTVMGAGAVRVANFATPGSGAAGSHFGSLDVTAASGGLTLANDIFVDGTLSSVPTGLTPTITGGGKTVTAMAVGINTPLTTSLIFDNAPLIINEQGTIRSQQFDRAQFQNFPTNATLLDMTMVGTALTPRSVVFNNDTFQTSVTNLYAKLVSSNALGVTVTINASNDPTGGPSKSNPPFGTTVNGARIVWQ